MAETPQEPENESWLTRNARPATVFFCLFLLAYVIILCPIFGLVDATIKALTGIPDHLWSVITVGLGAYPLARSAEKIVRTLKDG